MKINFNKNKYIEKFDDIILLTFKTAFEVLNILEQDVLINFAIISDNQIKNMNNIYRGIDKVTDVLSFPSLVALDKSKTSIICDKLSKENYPYDVDHDLDLLVLGDIYLCINKVKAQAKEYGTGEIREVAYLSLHGLLHLLGFDHIDEKDKLIMRETEEKILSKINILRGDCGRI